MTPTSIRPLFAALTAAWFGLAGMAPAHAAEATVAVAANFTAPARTIGEQFAKATGHAVVFSFGATGQLYAQISQGAPFDVFLAADAARPARAIEEGLAVPGPRFTYATGRLVLYSADPARVRGAETLRGDFRRLAIANPATAPYGAAALETIDSLGVRAQVEGKIVQGANIAQTYQFVATGNADLGFVALTQVIDRPGGAHWLVPETLHRPIAQDAVLLSHGDDNPAARAFLDYLRGPQARATIEKFGYGAGP